MWQQDLARLLRVDLGSAVLVPAGESTRADWAFVPTDASADLTSCLRELRSPYVDHMAADRGRVLVHLTAQGRGLVVHDLISTPDAEHSRPLEKSAAGAAAGAPDLYDARLAHARTRMLLRQAHGHRMRTDPQWLAQHWTEHCGQREEDDASRRLLLALATSQVARDRARTMRRAAPVRANLRGLTQAFSRWFDSHRCTPRGPMDPGCSSENIESIRQHLNLTIALATGVALRRGLHDLHLSAPENL